MLQPFRAAILLFLFTWLTVNVIHDFRLVVRSYTALPFWDGWTGLLHYLAYRHLDFPVFLEQHNEHRIVVPELIFAADDFLFHGRQVLPIILSCVFYFGTWSLLVRALLSSRFGNLFAKLCAILAAGILLTWSGSTLVLGSPFQIVWSVLFFCMASALFSIVKLHESANSLYCALAIICAIAATFSAANGLLIWPVLIITALLLGISKRYIWALGISAVGSIGLYFTHYQFPPSHFRLIFEHPLSFISFAAAYLSVPFGPVSDSIAIITGLVSVCAFLCFGILAWRRNLIRTRPGIVLFGFYLIILLTAAMTAFGRIDPNNPAAIGAAMAHRYIVVPLQAWAALVMITGWILGKSKFQLWAAPLAAVLLGLFLANQSPKIKAWLQNPRYTFFSSPQIASLCFQSGLEDSSIIKTVLPVVDAVRSLLPVMRHYRLSIFHDGRETWIGKPAQSVFSYIDSHPQAGAVTVVYPIESGLELIGWSEGQRSIFHPEKLVFLNEEHKIIGFGSKLPEDLPPGFTTLNTPSSLAWIGFANLAIPSKSISAFRVDRSGRSIFPIGESVSLNSLNGVKSVPAGNAGSVLSSGDWAMSGAWRKNGALPGQPQGEAPQGNYFDDWSGGKATGGELVSPPLGPSDSCLIIPVAHGPQTGNLQIRVTDPTVTTTLASVPISGADLSWRYWELRLPVSISKVRITATDRHRDGNQWLVIGEPRLCK